jgi:hypothetical protein
MLFSGPQGMHHGFTLLGPFHAFFRNEVLKTSGVMLHGTAFFSFQVKIRETVWQSQP